MGASQAGEAVSEDQVTPRIPLLGQLYETEYFFFFFCFYAPVRKRECVLLLYRCNFHWPLQWLAVFHNENGAFEIAREGAGWGGGYYPMDREAHKSLCKTNPMINLLSTEKPQS